jgi:hypothetical protein
VTATTRVRDGSAGSSVLRAPAMSTQIIGSQASEFSYPYVLGYFP